MNKLLLTLMSLVTASCLATDIIPGQVSSQAVLIKGATLHTVTDGVKPNTDLLFEAGVIKQIASNITPVANTKVIEASGKHVYPGLIGLSSNLGLVEIGAVRATRDASETGRVTPEVKAHIAYNADSELIPTVRSNGITHVESSPDGGGLMGQSSLMQLDAWNWQDALVKAGTGMHLQWPQSGINKSFWEKRPPEKQKEDQEKERARLKELFAQIKAYDKARQADKQQAIDVRWEAMRPVLRGDMPLFIHVNDYRQIEEAIHFAQSESLKVILVGVSDADKAIDLLQAHKIPVIYTSPWGRPDRSDEALDKAYRMPGLLEQKGIEYALTVGGSWNMRDLPFAAGQSIAYGVSPETALKSITLTPAELLGVDETMGSLTVGKQATLIISQGDLFDHLTHHVETMYIDGRPVDLDNRHKRLYEKYSKKDTIK